MTFRFTITLLTKQLRHEKYIAAGADRFAKKRVKELQQAIELLKANGQTKLFQARGADLIF